MSLVQKIYRELRQQGITIRDAREGAAKLADMNLTQIEGLWKASRA